MRRFFALLTSISMLHLMLVGGDLACASHAHGGSSSMSGMAMGATAAATDAAPHAHAGGGAAASEAVASPAKDCAVPASSRCCVAMSSCSVIGDVSVSGRLSGRWLPASSTPRIAQAQLESLLLAPEPPPPKA